MDITKHPRAPGIRFKVQIWQEDPEKKELAQVLFNELYVMVVCVEYYFCDKCATAD